MAHIVVITGAGAGVGRATVTEFARNRCDVALLCVIRIALKQRRPLLGVSACGACPSRLTSPTRCGGGS